jgi:hypothetical protein
MDKWISLPLTLTPELRGLRRGQARLRLHQPGQYLEGVLKEVWEFHVGGYQVCEKWLKDRRGRQLSFDDLMHYQKMVVALKKTIRLMTEIDRTIPGLPIE